MSWYYNAAGQRFELPERPLEPPADKPLPRCPVCGEETDVFYIDKYREIAGCDNCLRGVESWYESEVKGNELF